MLVLTPQPGPGVCPSLRARKPQPVGLDTPRGWGWCGERCWLVWSSLPGAAPQQHFTCCPSPFSGGRAGLATGFTLLVYQATNLPFFHSLSSYQAGYSSSLGIRKGAGRRKVQNLLGDGSHYQGKCVLQGSSMNSHGRASLQMLQGFPDEN